jgi:mRNA-degrading endonuclease RelE of RelBE toxin-antitoxin system
MKFIWPDSARAELRAIDRNHAIHILEGLTRYAEAGFGDVKALTGEWQGYSRLRIGEYRVIFSATPEQIVIARVRSRSDVYK